MSRIIPHSGAVMTDEELCEILKHALGISGGSGGGGPDSPDFKYCGAGIKIWGGWSWPIPKDPPL
jgi:hypothetical protein